MTTRHDDISEPYHQLVRGTPFAVYAGQARRNMRTLSQSSNPPMATPASQSNSLPDPEPFEQRPPLMQTYSHGYEYGSTYYTPQEPIAEFPPQWSAPYQSASGQPPSFMSAIPAWASDTARFQQNPIPLPNELFQVPIHAQQSLAPTGTVQPSAIFGRSEVKDISYPQTSLGTPATSARATPVDDEPYLRLQQATRAGIPAGTWQCAPPKTDPVPTVKVLHSQTTMDRSMEGDDGHYSEMNESPLVVSPLLPPNLAKSGAGEKKKRTRTPQACEACRKRKAKVSLAQ